METSLERARQRREQVAVLGVDTEALERPPVPCRRQARLGHGDARDPGTARGRLEPIARRREAEPRAARQIAGFYGEVHGARRLPAHHALFDGAAIEQAAPPCPDRAALQVA